jgi:fatty-acyl-CoA synthase
MAVYKAPRSIQFVDALPKSGAGKVMWRKLQELE